jgi:hypothetical protein
MSRKDPTFISTFVKYTLVALTLLLVGILVSLYREANAQGRPGESKGRGPGVNFIARGTLWPVEVVEEINKTLDKLRAARKNYKHDKKYQGKLKRMLDAVIARVKALEKDGSTQEDLSALITLIGETNEGMRRIEKNSEEALAATKAHNEKQNNLTAATKANAAELSKLKSQVGNALLQRGWGLEAYAQLSTHWGPGADAEDDTILCIVGGTLYLRRGGTWLRVSAGAGASILKPVRFSWQFQTSLEFQIKKYALVGPVVSLAYDMTEQMDGAYTWLWTAGGRLRILIPQYTKLSVTIDAGTGLYGRLNDHLADINVALGIAHDISVF